ncbi:MAG TPA: methylmalonyl-CoA epimerase [Bacteroidota bacterium]|jgi:methylmalonyl-CoA/ethylmalonyl-CoA epimerase|nr:methylmalonyl-CoA epimerase [Bacteroidota bacterium]
MERKLSHVGIAVKDLEESSRLFSKLLGIGVAETETVVDQRVRVAVIHLGEASLELTQAISPESPIAKFIEKRGEGIHHVSFEVDDIRSELARLRAEGFQLIDEQPRVGAGGCWIAFLHPKSTNGVLVEISQKIVQSGFPPKAD